ncbi:MAG: hypothetical protein V8R80_11020 [Eubacterium sp.]
MQASIFHSVNSGLYICNGDANVLIDGIHKGREKGFSEMPIKILDQMKKGKGIFDNLNNLLFTHDHSDHYNQEKLACFVKKSNRPISVYGGGIEAVHIQHIPISDNVEAVRMNGVVLLSMKTMHELNIYRNTVHRSFWVRIKDETFFVAGDAVLSAEHAKMIAGLTTHSITGAFFQPIPDFV